MGLPGGAGTWAGRPTQLRKAVDAWSRCPVTVISAGDGRRGRDRSCLGTERAFSLQN